MVVGRGVPRIFCHGVHCQSVNDPVFPSPMNYKALAVLVIAIVAVVIAFKLMVPGRTQATEALRDNLETCVRQYEATYAGTGEKLSVRAAEVSARTRLRQCVVEAVDTVRDMINSSQASMAASRMSASSVSSSSSSVSSAKSSSSATSRMPSSTVTPSDMTVPL